MIRVSARRRIIDHRQMEPISTIVVSDNAAVFNVTVIFVFCFARGKPISYTITRVRNVIDSVAKRA